MQALRGTSNDDYNVESDGVPRVIPPSSSRPAPIGLPHLVPVAPGGRASERSDCSLRDSHLSFLVGLAGSEHASGEASAWHGEMRTGMAWGGAPSVGVSGAGTKESGERQRTRWPLAAHLAPPNEK